MPSVSTADRGCDVTSVPFTKKRTWELPISTSSVLLDRPWGAGLDVVVQHSLRRGQDLFGRAPGLRVTGKFPTGALGEQAQQFHRVQYRSFS